MALRLEKGVAEAIRQHGAATYPNECCGALFGGERQVTATFALSNTTEEGPRRRFLVRPQDYRAAEREASARGADLLGFYHSHPDHPAEPSEYDREHAWPGYSYVIASLGAENIEDMRSWTLRDDRSGYDEETIVG